MPLPVEDWLDKLDKQLQSRAKDIQIFEDYYSGQNHRLAFATDRFRNAFGSLFSTFADNWCGLVVDAAVERLKVEGFRFDIDDPNSDSAAWEIWQRNGLDAKSKLAHREAVKTGEAYVIVDPNKGGGPVITVEHPSQVTVAYSPAHRNDRLAALKKWIDHDDGFVYATLYLPDEIYKFRSDRQYNSGLLPTRINWKPRADDPWGDNPLGIVPVVPLMNNPSLLHGGQSDLQSVIPMQDACNKLLSDMLVASEYTAFQQRWATGIEVKHDPITGEVIEAPFLKMSVSRLFVSQNPDTKFGAFPSTDLSPYVKSVEMLVQHVAAQTRTPPHYLLGQSGAFPSGESLQATETGLVARVEDKQETFGEAWEEILRLAFRAQGDKRRGEAFAAETIWRDPESRTEGEHVDATLKLSALGVPNEILWERVGFTPQQIQRIKELNDTEQPQLPAPVAEQVSEETSVAMTDLNSES